MRRARRWGGLGKFGGELLVVADEEVVPLGVTRFKGTGCESFWEQDVVRLTAQVALLRTM